MEQEGGIFQEGAVTGMNAVLGAMDTVTALMGDVWELMTSNPYLTLFVAAALIPIGVRVFRSIKHAARS